MPVPKHIMSHSRILLGGGTMDFSLAILPLQFGNDVSRPTANCHTLKIFTGAIYKTNDKAVHPEITKCQPRHKRPLLSLPAKNRCKLFQRQIKSGSSYFVFVAPIGPMKKVPRPSPLIDPYSMKRNMRTFGIVQNWLGFLKLVEG